MRKDETTEDARPTPDPLMIMEDDYTRGFAVVVERVVGEVVFDSNDGYQSPHHAALSVIGRSGEEGRFSFPHEDGGRTVVEVTFPLREGAR